MADTILKYPKATPNEYTPMRWYSVLAWLCVVAWMVAIFMFSAQPADESNAQSGSVVELIARVVYPGYADLSLDEQAQVVERYQYVVRKCGHFTEYLILGALCTVASRQSFFLEDRASRRKYGAALFAVALSVLYAVSDEIHQLYVVGRSCRLTDVLIDASGAIVGAVILTIVIERLIRLRGREG
ncbi:MAG: VanZ family protein [Actinobacteria bacterium]|nr:VanZ family protein [Actinomycetota bacterium]